MIHLDLKNIPELALDGTQIPDFLEKIQARGQGFYKVLDDEEMLQKIQAFADSVKNKYQHIVVLGIGGSALGTITLRDSLNNFFVQSFPQLHVLENIDPTFLHEALEALDISQTLFIPISKSGGTPETLAQYLFFHKAFLDANLDPKNHFVAITGKSGLLRELAEKDNLPLFDVPEDVGGRFSVLTPVGLLPAALINIDIKSLMTGAREMRDKFISENLDQNLAFQLAIVQFNCSQKGQNQNVLMPYATKLRTFAAWFAQLLAESTGKIDASGNHIGLTPIPALGVTDQHSQLQLFAQGPKDKLVIFIRVKDHGVDLEIPVEIDHEKVNFLKDKTFSDLLNAEQRATADTLSEDGRPNLTIEIEKLDAEHLGQLFLLFEGATAFLGEFLDINAFDQPGVERSKVLTRKYLS